MLTPTLTKPLRYYPGKGFGPGAANTVFILSRGKAFPNAPGGDLLISFHYKDKIGQPVDTPTLTLQKDKCCYLKLTKTSQVRTTKGKLFVDPECYLTIRHSPANSITEYKIADLCDQPLSSQVVERAKDSRTMTTILTTTPLPPKQDRTCYAGFAWKGGDPGNDGVDSEDQWSFGKLKTR